MSYLDVKQIQPYFTELLVAALELLTSCHCSGETGCPNCVQVFLNNPFFIISVPPFCKSNTEKSLHLAESEL